MKFNVLANHGSTQPVAVRVSPNFQRSGGVVRFDKPPTKEIDMSQIEWTDETWNPIAGCSLHSAGCDNCYAERMSIRQAGMNAKGKLKGSRPQYDGVVDKREWTGLINAAPAHIFNKPLMTKRPTIWFVNSMSDAFHENIDHSVLIDMFEIMNACPHHSFQVLTKRPARAVKLTRELGLEWTSNIWLGASVAENKFAKPFVRELLKVPASVRFISAEPLLEALPHLDVAAVDWVIAGGESGISLGQRPIVPLDGDWVRDLRDRCAFAGTPFFFKQWGAHDANGKRVGKKDAGHELDGMTLWQMPASVFDRTGVKNPQWTRVSKPTMHALANGQIAPKPSQRELVQDAPYILIDPETGHVEPTWDEDEVVLHILTHDQEAAGANPNFGPRPARLRDVRRRLADIMVAALEDHGDQLRLDAADESQLVKAMIEFFRASRTVGFAKIQNGLFDTPDPNVAELLENIGDAA
jgi:protein gp37